MPAERTVVGGSVAALVAADTLAAAGRPVRLILPDRGVGGGFAAIRREGRTLELGVRLLELSYEDDGAPIPALADYVPGIGGHRPYARLVREWVLDLLGDRVVPVAAPKMVFDGRLVDDILFTVDLSSLPAMLPPAEREAMAAEVSSTLDATGRDAGVLDPALSGALAQMTLQEGSVANHGPRFHARVIAPLCDKVLHGGASRVLAPLRRQAWAPIFHPRTLLQALRGERPGFRPRRTFESVSPDGCVGLVDALVERIEARPQVAVEHRGALTGLAAHGSGVTLRFAGGDEIVVERPVLGTTPGELFTAAGIQYAPEKVRTALAWLEADPDDCSAIESLVHVLMPENPVLRVSTGGRAATTDHRLLCVELRHDVADDALAGAATDGLTAAGLLREGAAVTSVMAAARPTFVAPTAATRDDFERARSAFADLGLDVEVLGGGLGLGADQLNEQIIQGLRTGATT
jgi:hypothetical protein